MSLYEHPDFDNHEQVLFCHDKASGLSAIIAIHNTNLGASLGGCRMWPYTTSAEALTDVLRLSKGMTYKAAMAGLPQGGGKSVIIGTPKSDKSVAKMQSMGRYIQGLSGAYIGAQDSGITVEDVQQMSTQTDHVGGINGKFNYLGEPSDGNPAPSTAYGVFVGIQASVKYKLNRDLSGLHVAIQGLGHVGLRLAQHLYNAGARLTVADISADNLAFAEEKLSAKIVSTEDILSVEADVLAPCALGGSINAQSLSVLNTSIIAGAANNQLADESFGDALTQRGILYAPDYVINAGGIIDIYHQRVQSNADAMRSQLEGIGRTLQDIYRQSEVTGRPTNQVADNIARTKFLND